MPFYMFTNFIYIAIASIPKYISSCYTARTYRAGQHDGMYQEKSIYNPYNPNLCAGSIPIN